MRFCLIFELLPKSAGKGAANYKAIHSLQSDLLLLFLIPVLGKIDDIKTIKSKKTQAK